MLLQDIKRKIGFFDPKQDSGRKRSKAAKVLPYPKIVISGINSTAAVRCVRNVPQLLTFFEAGEIERSEPVSPASSKRLPAATGRPRSSTGKGPKYGLSMTVPAVVIVMHDVSHATLSRLCLVTTCTHAV
jgi:hypothetical protein